MSKFEAGKTYPLRGGGEGEIFVTRDGNHWGRILSAVVSTAGDPTSWNEQTGANNLYGSKDFDLIAPPTTVERMKEYAHRDIEALGEHYTRHTYAMTAEDLHDMSDIAAELAYRDIELEQCQQKLGECEGGFETGTKAIKHNLELITELEKVRAEHEQWDKTSLVEILKRAELAEAQVAGMTVAIKEGDKP